MNKDIEQDLILIKESILQAVPAEAIYLFGSHAYGEPTAESDIDIFVVVPDETAEIGELYADIRGLIRQKKRRMELDLLIDHASIFNRRKSGPTLERIISEKGTVLYG